MISTVVMHGGGGMPCCCCSGGGNGGVAAKKVCKSVSIRIKLLHLFIIIIYCTTSAVNGVERSEAIVNIYKIKQPIQCDNFVSRL